MKYLSSDFLSVCAITCKNRQCIKENRQVLEMIYDQKKD